MSALQSSIRVGVVGAHGGLGREIIQQTMSRGHHVIPFARRLDPVPFPVRRGWLSPDDESVPPIMNTTVLSSSTLPLPDLDAIVFALSGKPFERDATTKTVSEICGHLPTSCRSVTLVSAWGVGDSIEKSNVGIRIMKDFYLKSTYSAKQEQEDIVSNLKDVHVHILRPKVLSFSEIPFNTISTPRQVLARQILDSVEKDIGDFPKSSTVSDTEE